MQPIPEVWPFFK